MQNCVKCGKHLLCRPKEKAGFGRSCSHLWSMALKLFQLLRKEKIFSYLPNSKLRLWRNAAVFIVTRSVTNNRLYGNERSTSNPIFTVHTLYTGFTTITICFNISTEKVLRDLAEYSFSDYFQAKMLLYLQQQLTLPYTFFKTLHIRFQIDYDVLIAYIGFAWPQANSFFSHLHKTHTSLLCA